jgi:hypothetical protein
MALRKPLVQVNGQLQQLQSNDYVTAYSIVTQTNNSGDTLLRGQPVYNDGANTVDLAQANADEPKEIIGLVWSLSALSGAPVDIILDGVLTAATAEWDAVFGTTGGLTPKTRYFLSPTTAGEGTATCPTSAGHYIVEVGIAISPTELLLSAPYTSILL